MKEHPTGLPMLVLEQIDDRQERAQRLIRLAGHEQDRSSDVNGCGGNSHTARKCTTPLAPRRPPSLSDGVLEVTCHILTLQEARIERSGCVESGGVCGGLYLLRYPVWRGVALERPASLRVGRTAP